MATIDTHIYISIGLSMTTTSFGIIGVIADIIFYAKFGVMSPTVLGKASRSRYRAARDKKKITTVYDYPSFSCFQCFGDASFLSHRYIV